MEGPLCTENGCFPDQETRGGSRHGILALKQERSLSQWWSTHPGPSGVMENHSTGTKIVAAVALEDNKQTFGMSLLDMCLDTMTRRTQIYDNIASHPCATSTAAQMSELWPL